MTASLWLVAGLACAQFDPAAVQPAPANAAQDAQGQAESVPAPRPSKSQITAVTVYQGQALVTREVTVPEGDGTIELVVTPLPAQTVDSSLYTEGTDGLRVLSTRFRTRAVKEDTREEVRAKQEQLKTLQADAQRLQKEIAVQGQDLQYIQKLEGFTATSLTGLTKKGRLDSAPILTLSKFVMENRGAKSKTETDLRQRLQANTEAIEFAKRQLAELSAGSSRVERDAVIVVQKARREAGTVRLGYLVGSANWWPQYRLRGGSGADNAPARLEYLAALTQQTGEPWSGVRVTLSTARPSLEAAPPELLPLKMAVAGVVDTSPIEGKDDRSQRIVAELGKLIDMPFANETPLEDVIKYVRAATKSPTYPDGIPIYIDPIGLQQAERSLTSTVTIDLKQVPLKTSLKLLLGQLGLTYTVQDGLLKITSINSGDRPIEGGETVRGGFLSGTGAMGGEGLTREQAQASGEREAQPSGGRRTGRGAARHGRSGLRPAGGREGGPQCHVPHRGPTRHSVAPGSAVARGRPGRPGGRVLRQGRARPDPARLPARQADQQERSRAAARRGHGVCRRRLRRPNAIAPRRRRRAVHRRFRR